MDIEVLSQGKFTTTGSATKKMIHVLSWPSLDLIVRESIQNSLDAQMKGVREVKVDFKYSTFNKIGLANEFPQIKEKLLKINGNEFISIRDSNTVGLTGDLEGKFKVGELNQNLGKLVFHIMKPQTEQCAGGSFGVGKTVYYRFGKGFVIFYSRIKLDSGRFQERLVAALVEDETQKNGLLSDYSDNIGVAFFGENVNGSVRAITDENYIHNFLKLFGINPFVNTETGTQIIIPFINSNELLSFKEEYSINDKEWWKSNIEEYLKVSILRWYFPRMSQNYPIEYGARLKATVNGTVVTPDQNTPLFELLSKFADVAYTRKKEKGISVKIIEKKTNMKETELGQFIYKKVTSEELSLKYLPDPYRYVGVTSDDSFGNHPIIAFTRRPGMIVNYDLASKYYGYVTCGKNEYVIGLFVLNSNNEINAPFEMKLDEYVRGGEPSDHSLWNDHAVDGCSTRVLIVKQINDQTGRELKIVFGTKEDNAPGEEVMNYNFAQRFGQIFMADTGGAISSTKTKSKGKSRSGQGKVAGEDANKIDFDRIVHRPHSLILEYTVSIVMTNYSISFENLIETADATITATKYEEDGLIYPCDIVRIAMQTIKKDGEIVKNPETKMIDDFILYERYEHFLISYLKTKSGKVYGLKFANNEPNRKIDFKLKIELETKDKLLRTNFAYSLRREK